MLYLGLLVLLLLEVENNCCTWDCWCCCCWRWRITAVVPGTVGVAAAGGGELLLASLPLGRGAPRAGHGAPNREKTTVTNSSVEQRTLGRSLKVVNNRARSLLLPQIRIRIRTCSSDPEREQNVFLIRIRTLLDTVAFRNAT